MPALDRRRLLASGAAAAVFASTGLGAQAAPSCGGVLRLGVSGGHAGDRFSAPRPFGTFMKIAGHGCVFDCLTEIGPDGTLRGELATQWEPRDGGREWIFTLRRDAVFHDGRRFEASDAVASLRRHLQDRGGPGWRALSGMVGITKLAPHQIRLVFASPIIDAPFLLADPHLIMHPAREWRRALQQGIGTGLYQLTAFEPGRYVRAERVRDHWKGDQAGWFDRVDLYAVASPSARLEALVSGAADAIEDPLPHAVPTLERMAQLGIHSLPGNRHWVARPRDVDPETASRLREALIFGLPRQALADHMLAGQGAPSTDSPLGQRNHYARGKPGQWNPERARKIICALGGGPLRVELPAQTTDVAEALQPMLVEAGIAVVEPGQGDVAFELFSGRATETWAFSVPPAGAPHWIGTDERRAAFDRLLNQARGSSASADRERLAATLEDLTVAHGSVAVPVSSNYLIAASNRLSCAPNIGHTWAMDDGRIAERWWFT